jgi:hypothetical protein
MANNIPKATPLSTSALSTERGNSYGDFDVMAELSQKLKMEIEEHDRKSSILMTVSQKEAMELILLKIARIAVGDAQHEDSWRDIAGYANLAAERCAI